MKYLMKKEEIIRNSLIGSTFISLLIDGISFTFLIIFSSNNIADKFFSNFLGLIVLNNILIYILGIIYIIIAIKSKKEEVIKVTFSLFSIMTTLLFIELFMYVISEIFII